MYIMSGGAQTINTDGVAINWMERGLTVGYNRHMD